MKLIIDIPDEYLDQIKNNTEGYTAESIAIDAIRNSIPYEESLQVTVFAENASKAEYWNNIGSADILQELPQYHFERDAFVSTFEQVFTWDEIVKIEDLCQHHKQVGDFLLFYSSEEEFYIIYLPSGTLINWYKHLGRTNTCNKENFSTADLRHLLERLKADIKENNNADNY